MKWDRIFFWTFGLVGLGIGAYICYSGWSSFVPQDYCLQFEDDFQSGGINMDHWSYDIQLGGFGTGSFDWTTSDPKNVYVDDQGLHIVPTLTTETTSITEAQLENGYTLNLTADGTCTTPDWTQCAVVSNSTNATIINPVRSARLVTRGKQTLRYGKVEVVAKLPIGDWLWPAIWMMPESSVYGDWPKSGEIDIMESRGNEASSGIGRDVVSGALHWGPNTQLDMFQKTNSFNQLSKGDFSDDFHTFGVQWSPNYIVTYVDNILKQSLYTPFGKQYGDMYGRGKFGGMDWQGNGPPGNPWGLSSNPNAPFDADFYLILNVAVGGTTGYFPDGVDGKPWADRVNGSAKQFWDARNAWKPTWGPGDKRGMTIKKVSMWKVC